MATRKRASARRRLGHCAGTAAVAMLLGSAVHSWAAHGWAQPEDAPGLDVARRTPAAEARFQQVANDHSAHQSTRDVIAISADIEVKIEKARRTAPFDLSWGTE